MTSPLPAKSVRTEKARAQGAGTKKVGSGALKRLLSNPLGLVPAICLSVIVLLAAIAPLLGLPDPGATNLHNAVLLPSSEHLLGTDTSGRDVLSRLLWGSRVNLLGAAIAVVVAFVIGVTLGLLAGYYGGWFDFISSWFNNLNMALPGIVILLAVSSVVGPSVWIAMTVFGVILSPGFFRIVRGAVMSVRNELYVDAARVAGLSDARIIAKHILTVVRAPVIIQSARLAAIAIGVQAGLEFLGISDSRQPSWGQMLNEGFRRIAGDPQLVLWPCLVIGIVSVSLVLLGNALRDSLEDRKAAPRTQEATASAEQSPRERGAEEVTASNLQDSTADGAQAPLPAGQVPDKRLSDALLSLRGVRVAYGHDESLKEVVKGANLHVASGEVLGLVGESGSGKTQIAFSVLGLLPEGGRVTSGSIFYRGQDLVKIKRKEHAGLRGSDIAYIPQEPMSNLDPSFKIGYQLTVPMRKKQGISKQEAKAKALRLLARVGIPDPTKTFNSYPHEVSGGMAQRVLIAGAISCEPKLLIADEPTTALDVTVQAEVLDLLRELQDEFGMAIILVTHNFGVVADICDRVAVMQTGTIVESGTAEAIFANPQHPYTQTLLDSILEDAEPRDYPFDDEESDINGAASGETREGSTR